jgi:hypothetical protein
MKSVLCRKINSNGKKPTGKKEKEKEKEKKIVSFRCER